MKKKIVALLIATVHKQSLAALAVATVSGGGVGFFTMLLGLSPEVWAFATFGAAYAYMLRKDAPRNRLLTMFFSIIIAVFGSDAAASYIANAHDVRSVFLTPLIALLIAASFPWMFEKYVTKKP